MHPPVVFIAATMLKAVFFDAVGTLIYLPRSVGDHYREVAADFGANLETDELNAAFKRAWIEAPARKQGPGPRADDDKGWWRELVRSVLQQTLSTSATRFFDVESYFNAVYERFTYPGVWRTFEDVEPVLQSLRSRNLLLGVISNFDQRLYRILEELGLKKYFDSVTISSEVGSDKPDRLIFQTALSTLRVVGTESMHVGDDHKKDGGANAVGMQVFCIRRPECGLLPVLQLVEKTERR